MREYRTGKKYCNPQLWVESAERGYGISSMIRKASEPHACQDIKNENIGNKKTKIKVLKTIKILKSSSILDTIQAMLTELPR